MFGSRALSYVVAGIAAEIMVLLIFAVLFQDWLLLMPGEILSAVLSGTLTVVIWWFAKRLLKIAP